MSNLDKLNKILAEQMQRAESYYDKKTIKGMIKDAVKKYTKAYSGNRETELREPEGR